MQRERGAHTPSLEIGDFCDGVRGNLAVHPFKQKSLRGACSNATPAHDANHVAVSRHIATKHFCVHRPSDAEGRQTLFLSSLHNLKRRHMYDEQSTPELYEATGAFERSTSCSFDRKNFVHRHCRNGRTHGRNTSTMSYTFNMLYTFVKISAT